MTPNPPGARHRAIAGKPRLPICFPGFRTRSSTERLPAGSRTGPFTLRIKIPANLYRWASGGNPRANLSKSTPDSPHPIRSRH